MAEFTLTVNGQAQEVDTDPEDRLLYVLRNQLELNGPKFGCGIAQCGACTVLIDGAPGRSCSIPMDQADGATITTLEGLGTEASPDPLQQAFIEEQAAQCGYCLNGMIMTAKSLLEQNPTPDETEIREALAANLCRCGTHNRIVKAIQRVVEEGAST